MHSYEYLLKEVEEKLMHYESLLSACEVEKTTLNNNLNSVKQAVDESFKRHIGTLQCRAKWLTCHADSIYHLKDGSLTHQIAELELVCGELKSCLEASDCTLNKNEEIKMMARNVLHNAANISHQPCESSTLSFHSLDEEMEEMIISLGDINDDNSSTEHMSSDYDLLSDEGIFVIDTLKKQHSIEMEVKSIEMHHLTPQSANSEKEDFERIEMEMQPVVGVSRETAVLSQSDSAYEEGSDSSKSVEWLHRPLCTPLIEVENKPQVAAPQEGVSSVAQEIVSKDSNSLVQCADANKVPLWLIGCEESTPWILNSRSKALSSKKPMESLPTTRDDKEREVQLQVGDEPPPPKKSYIARGTFDHFDSILKSSNSAFLRDEDKAKRNSFLLDEAINSLTLSANPQPLLANQDKERKDAIFSHFNDIFATSDLQFLHRRTNNDNNNNMERSSVCAEAEAEADLDRSICLANSVKSSMRESGMKDMSNPFSMDTSTANSTVNSNLDHLNRIADTSHSAFLVGLQDESQHGAHVRVPATPYIKATAAVEHMRMLEKRPDHLYLQASAKPILKSRNDDMCEWLRGKSSDRCGECPDFDTCGYSDRFDGKWIKTATDW